MAARIPVPRHLRGRGLRRKALTVLAGVSPGWILHELRHRHAQKTRREARGESDGAFDVRWIEIDDVCRIALFWSIVPGVGSGPSASVYVFDSEVLRLDCFGADEGHMHLNPTQVNARRGPSDPRVYFEPAAREDHVDNARFELVTNLGAALAANDLARVRLYEPDPERLQTAAADMAEQMSDLIVKWASP